MKARKQQLQQKEKEASAEERDLVEQPKFRTIHLQVEKKFINGLMLSRRR